MYGLYYAASFAKACEKLPEPLNYVTQGFVIGSLVYLNLKLLGFNSKSKNVKENQLEKIVK